MHKGIKKNNYNIAHDFEKLEFKEYERVHFANFPTRPRTRDVFPTFFRKIRVKSGKTT